MLRWESVSDLPPRYREQAARKILGNQPKPTAETHPPAADKQQKPPKYRNNKVTVDGVTYDSEGEYKRYCDLKMLERAGEISDLKSQVRIVLQDGFVLDGQKYKPIVYVADFTYKDRIGTVIEDFKSEITKKDKAYVLKKKMLLALIASGKIQGRFIETMRK